MQTITLNVSDDFMPKFMGVLDALPKNKIKIKKSAMALELEKRVKEIEDGTNPSVPFEEGFLELKERLTLVQFDAKTRFELKATQGDVSKGMALSDKLDKELR